MSLVAEPKEKVKKTEYIWRQCQYTKNQIDFFCFKTASQLCEKAFCLRHCKKLHPEGH